MLPTHFSVISTSMLLQHRISQCKLHPCCQSSCVPVAPLLAEKRKRVDPRCQLLTQRVGCGHTPVHRMATRTARCMVGYISLRETHSTRAASRSRRRHNLEKLYCTRRDYTDVVESTTGNAPMFTSAKVRIRGSF